jgi:hypothetical protein
VNALRIARFCLIAAAGFAAGVAWNQEASAQLPPPAPQAGAFDEGVQVLTRGPVHEAFAEAVSFDPQPGLIIPQRPPDPIEESPPEHRPAGEHVTWIPGYWAWDDERNDFLWVSGTWRALPPGRQWVTGYWGQSSRGYQWISGYWADAAAEEIEYLPEPPTTVETGPNIAAPSADHNWIPGCWVWQQNRYAWRPGFWAAAHQDWTWIPAHYVWAPRGYVFVEGYWDYSVARRGVLFAPVYFQSRVYTQRSYSYSPRTVISLSALASHLFVRPSYQHYYFGDYYGSSYARSGYYPSYSFHSSRSGYDPLYAQQRWQHRDDNQWEQRTQAEYQRRREQEAARPPRTWEEQQIRMRQEASRNERSFAVGESLEQWTKSPDNSQQFQPLTNEERRELALRWQAARKFTEERQQWETNPEGAGRDPRVPATDPSRAPSEPGQALTDPRLTPRDPARTPAEPARTPTDPARIPTDPRLAPKEPARIPTDPRLAPKEPARVPTDPRLAPKEPARIPTDPRLAPKEPARIPTDPRLTPSAPAAIPTDPSKVPAEPQASPRATPPPKAEPQPAPQKSGTNPKGKQPK